MEWERIWREVETLWERKHPNIVELLGAYTLHLPDRSGNPSRVMYLLFPWAEMDLKKWMNSYTNPTTMKRDETKLHIYSSMYALVSGVAYLHRAVEGKFTSHHDLKPRNILVMGNEFKIADFGYSHLRPTFGGSATRPNPGLGIYEYQPPEYWTDD